MKNGNVIEKLKKGVFMVTYEELKKDAEIQALIAKGNSNLEVMGYTDHSIAHCVIVAERASYILKTLGYDEHLQELAKVAGILHDIGNAINRTHHAETGALLSYQILKKKGMQLPDLIDVISAIGNHDESTGGAKDVLSASIILADKSDVRRNRVRNKEKTDFDIHDRVNYAVTGSSLKIDSIERKISLNLQIDVKMCSMYEYFEIFLGRMMMCRKAAELLDATFRLTVNGIKVL